MILQLGIELLCLGGAVLTGVALLRGRRSAGLVLLVLVVLSVANFSFVPYLVGKNLFPVYRYVSSDGGFNGIECFKSTACYWSSLQAQFHEYETLHPGVDLHRLEVRRAWAFWHWYDYATHPRWELHYAGP